jgi:TatA/E family protein of Tat protein translocase
MPPSIGIRELALLIFLVLLFAGTKRIPQVGRALGHGFREFKAGVSAKTITLGERTVRPKNAERDH